MPTSAPIHGKRKAWGHNGKSRHERGYGSLWDKLRILALRRDKGLCQICLRDGRTELANQVDHIVPKAKGGTDDLWNLQSLCADHHRAKTAADSGRRVKPRIGVDGWPM